jgi:hypothetical protein
VQTLVQEQSEPNNRTSTHAESLHFEHGFKSALTQSSGPDTIVPPLVSNLQFNFSRIPITAPGVTSRIQAKLEVGASDDPLEREADEMAHEALHVSTEAVDGVPGPEVTAVRSGSAPTGPETRQADEEETVRRYSVSDKREMNDQTETRIASLSGKGSTLPDPVRGSMERGFGFDFSRVRIHTEPATAETAQALGAQAYTYESNIVFAPGRYSPETGAGRQLLAHELAHVVQQRGNKALSRTARMQRHRRHLTPEEAATRASDAATNMSDFLTQNILFDFWGGDLRDNDKNGVVDGFLPTAAHGRDRRETRSNDGDHFDGDFDGFDTIGGLTFTGGEGGTVDTVDFSTTTTVKYRVCADLVSAAYRTAGIRVPRTRRVRDLVHWFTTNRQAQFWPIDTFPGTFQPGDFICSYSPREGHGHAGMIVEAGTSPEVVHLPGPSQHIARGVYDPTRENDVTRETWPSNRAIFGVGRFVG